MRLYVHVPYCVSKCAYCGFYSEAAVPSPDFAGNLLSELSLRIGVPESGIESVYIGGGTPSVLGPDAFLRAARGICDFFGAAPPEFSVEVNPADVTERLAAAFAEAGVTRVSLGAQSFLSSELSFLGRRHSPDETVSAVEKFRSAGIENVGLDLIAGVPGFGGEMFMLSVSRALSLSPAHLSVYVLSIEKGSKFGRMGIVPPPDDEVMDQMIAASSAAERAGLVRYEISNFARPGCECNYNVAVWRGEDYAGIGPSAFSRLGRLRRRNLPDVKSWSSACRRGLPPPCEEEIVSSVEDWRERRSTSVRLLREGFVPPENASPAVLRNLERSGLIRRRADAQDDASRAYVLTMRGAEVADAVAEELFF